MITARGKVPSFDTIEIINNHQFIYSAISFSLQILRKKKNEIDISEKTFKNSITKTKFYLFFTSEVINYKITTP
jgi:hypothetical protein